MNIAFIPVRGGSKSIPLKNIKEINGKPLVYWAVKAASECRNIDKVVVSTDHPLIKSTVEQFAFQNVEVFQRDEKNASDTASTESAMLEYAYLHQFDNIALIQATSPLITSIDLENGFDIFNTPNTDSVLSVVKQFRFIWEDDKSHGKSINYDIFNRPRRQDFNGYYLENGAFYIISREMLIKTQNRLAGNIKLCEMHEDTAFEIDEPTDWLIVEQLMQKNKIKANLSNIKMLLTDCDGCLTDGGMYYSEHGDEMKKFNTRDGMAFGMLKDKGIITGIVTGEDVELNRRRANKMKVDELHMGIHDKLSVVKSIAEKRGIALSEIVYIGDDINDLSVLKAVGYSCCPSDAVDEVKSVVDYIAKASGGTGVIREVTSLIL